MPVAEFPLPDVGEGLTEAEIVQWRVALGDEIAVDQVLVEIETAKSLVELPSPFAGKVTHLLAAEGDTVEVGVPIIRVEFAGEPVPAMDLPGGSAHVVDAPPVPETVAPASPALPHADNASVQGTDETSGAVLVGYGSATAGQSRRRPGARRAAADAAEASRRADRADDEATAARGAVPQGATATAPEANPAATPAPETGETGVSRASRPLTVPAASALPVVAKPPIRKLAKDLGVDLSAVVATGLAGEVTRDDVIRHATQAQVFRNIETPEWGDVRRETIPVKGVRKAIATAMTTSAFTAPHVSLFVDVDATRTMEFVKRLKDSATFTGVKVSPLLIMAKAVIWAVRRNRSVNSTWTDREIIVHHFVNLGIAAATPRGLIVPNIKDAQDMSLLELAGALEQLTLTARDGKTTPEQMADGTITITNIGVFGMDTGTPILNPGEVGIVAMGTIKPKPWVVDGEVRSRMVTTIGASFDHRVVDGDVASRFVHDIASVLEEPALLLD
jgi:2-oxoisovalerate dehydrogenase E2 component (dihydrolipoyl transacylase)